MGPYGDQPPPARSPADQDEPRPAPDEPHELVPQRDTTYSIGPRNAGLKANLRNALQYPVEAWCRCGRRIVCDQMIGQGSDWRHEDRKWSTVPD